MLQLPHPPLSPLPFYSYRTRCSTPVHWFWDFELGAPIRRLDTSCLNFLNWLSGHNCAEANRIAEVRLVWACAQLAMDIGALGFSREGLGPGEPRADLGLIAIRSLARTCGTIS